MGTLVVFFLFRNINFNYLLHTGCFFTGVLASKIILVWNFLEYRKQVFKLGYCILWIGKYCIAFKEIYYETMAYIVITNKSSFYNSGWACLGLDGKRSFFQGSLKSSYDVFKLIAKSGCCDYTRFLFPTFLIFFFQYQLSSPSYWCQI